MRIAVLGGGIAGLTAAFHLQQEHDVVLFEASDRLGGNVHTEEIGGCLVEWGPQAFLDNEPRTLELVERLGLKDRLVRPTDEAARRFVWRDGKLRALPLKPWQFLFSSCLPLRARMRVLREPKAPGPPDRDESVHDFAARRIGQGAAEILVDAMVSGIWAGDPRRLSVRSAFPKLHALERDYGSLIKGAKGRAFGPKGVLTSFDRGMQVLIDALGEQVDARLAAPVERVDFDDFDYVLSTIPAPRLAEISRGELSELLQRIPTAPLAVVGLVLREPVHVPHAFGFLAPHGQGLRILGTLYESSIFPGRTPEGLRLYRVMIGGRRDPEAVQLDDGELTGIVLDDLGKVWGFAPQPETVHIFRHRLGIPQYEVGHQELLEQIYAHLPANFRIAGSSFRGVSVNLCIKEALEWSP